VLPRALHLSTSVMVILRQLPDPTLFSRMGDLMETRKMVEANTQIGLVQRTLKMFTAVLSLGLSLVLVIGGLWIWLRTSSWWNGGMAFEPSNSFVTAILVAGVGLVFGGIAFHFWGRRNSSWTLTQIIGASFIVVAFVGLLGFLYLLHGALSWH
jgi:hypothetical protein